MIDREDIESANARDLNEILRKEAGIDIKEYGVGLSSVAIRGIQASGILVLIDGRPVNSITTGMANISAFNVNTIDRIEIVKGSASNLYGANALGGVINIITKRGYARPEIALQAQVSSFSDDVAIDDQDFFVRVGYPLGRFTIGSSGAYRASDGFRENTDYESMCYNADVTYELAKGSISVNGGYAEKDYGIPGPLRGDGMAYSPYDREFDANLLGGLDVKWELDRYLQFANRLYVDRKQTDFLNHYTGYDGDTVIQDFHYLINTAGISSMLDYRLEKSEWVIGVDGRYDSLDAEENTVYSDASWRVSSFSAGAWFAMNKQITERALILAGLRFDYYPDFGSSFSPQIGLTNRITDWLTVKLSAGRAFRPPTFNDLYYPISGNPDLKPEYGGVYEFRIETVPSMNSFIALSAFQRRISDRIAWMPADNMLWRPQNLNRFQANGVEIETSLRSRHFRLELGGAYFDCEQQNDEIVYDFYDWQADTHRVEIVNVPRRAAHIPLYNLSFKVRIKLPYAVQLAASLVRAGESKNYYPDYGSYPDIVMRIKTLDAYQCVDLSVERDFMGVFTFVIGAKNLLNAGYATQFGYSIDDLDYPMPGRSIFARVKARISP